MFGNNVAANDRVRSPAVDSLHQRPVCFGHDNMGAGEALNHFGSSEVVLMAMCNENVLDVLGIHPHLLRRVHCVVDELAVHRVDHDQSVAGLQDVRTHIIDADVIEIVEDPKRWDRFGVLSAGISWPRTLTSCALNTYQCDHHNQHGEHQYWDPFHESTSRKIVEH